MFTLWVAVLQTAALAAERPHQMFTRLGMFTTWQRGPDSNRQRCDPPTASNGVVMPMTTSPELVPAGRVELPNF